MKLLPCYPIKNLFLGTTYCIFWDWKTAHTHRATWIFKTGPGMGWAQYHMPSSACPPASPSAKWIGIHVGGFWRSPSGFVGEGRHPLQTPLFWGPLVGVSHRVGVAALSVGSSHDRRNCCAGHLAVRSATGIGIKYISKGRTWFFLLFL